MDSATVVENWNSIIPQKIKAAELEHPTELFVFRCLISFFRMMQYDVTEFEDMYNEPKESIPFKRSRLVACTNELYQLSIGSAQSSFLYVDLIKPSPKKNIHVMNILLNFLFYVVMVRDETTQRASVYTSKYRELTATVNQLKREMENRKINLSNIEHNIEKMYIELPQLKTANKKLQDKKSALQSKIATIKTTDEDFARKVAKVKTEYASLQDLLVDDEEAACLIKKNEELEAAIEECENQEKTQLATTTEFATKISGLRSCIYAAEEILQIPQDNYLKSLKTEVDNLKLTYIKLKQEHAKKITQVEVMRKNCKSIQNYTVEKEKELAARRRSKKKRDLQKNKVLEELQKERDELRKKNNVYLEKIQVFKDELLLITQMAEQTKALLKRDPVYKSKSLSTPLE